jgi:hypothetical protein
MADSGTFKERSFESENFRQNRNYSKHGKISLKENIQKAGGN